MPKKPVTIRWVCDKYGLSDKTVRRKIKNGELVAYRCGERLIKLDADQVEAALMRPVGNSDIPEPAIDAEIKRIAHSAPKQPADDLDAEIKRIVDLAPKFSAAQRDAIAAIFADPAGGAA